ncbi:TrbC/VirB2 family protein [Paraburkholderia silvatlantica]|uniref:Type IV secretion system protein VirB2 n=1 Tax=Paraburkholderia silvatlantica TaxID=321895 RepID=A0ABR6FX44_9BURK|nr:TrbC/VirB2 family protein [Paraburkholderia silvatlantica]MBB2932002.1 type IV secretion system protein VirB2 [Paraburkholderia silvatlantica]PVY24677.1 type IV secretion system protein VirB2 [Paraburkholderia silvatlantica]PXW31173.1 type IV secretion system protein VirB2 [Paraburkholderia silvatlantica]
MKLGLLINKRCVSDSLSRRRHSQRVARGVTTVAAGVLAMSPAWAQLSQVNTLLTTIQTTLLGVGGVICSISIIWAGFRMMFQHARFGDIANVFIGGLFVGCATVIAGMLIPTS